MKLWKFLFIVYFSLTCSVSFSQQKFILQKSSNPGKVKMLESDREYTFITKDTIFNSRIVGVTDSSVILIGLVATGKDTIIEQKYYSKSSTFRTEHLWKLDTVSVLFSNIKYVRKPWFKNQEWIKYPVEFFSIPAALGLIGLPVAAIVLDNEDLKLYAITVGAFIGATVIPTVVGLGGRKFDTLTKWRLVYNSEKVD